MKLPLILLTNDDGVQSPGIAAAARALAGLGELVVAAPREQMTSAGRSLPVTSDGRIEQVELPGISAPVYAVGGTPAQAVLHAVLEILPRRPDLVVSGINYGENIGSGITASGTVGAALEGAALGIQSLAMSLQLLNTQWYEYHDLDFSAAEYFTAFFAQRMLRQRMPADVDLLKVDVPATATPQTDWRVTSQSRQRYYIPYLIREGGWDSRGWVSAKVEARKEDVEPDSDVYALMYDQVVSVTPISIDMTSRTNFSTLEMLLA
ncbi:MAG: 5'/3'-nucleotidase SurE [Anaerolineae bacterium]|nr:5'/3'-nucleotidase SurE [Anaerolineae bacterium]